MSGTTGRMGLYLFVIVMNLVFPVFAYTFTTYGDEPENFEIPLDVDTLNMAGITLIDAESHNLTFTGPWVYYVDINISMRARFMNDIYFGTVRLGDGIQIQRQSGIGKAFNSWAFPYAVNIKSWGTNQWFTMVSNASIVSEWDTTYNWSRFVLSDGHQVFITPEDTHNNITRGVFQDGHLNMTIAKTFEEETHFNFWRFLGWYTSLMIGDRSWGLPQVFSWVIRILGAVSILSVIMLTKELIRG
jgi:hypothetical protein